MELGKPINIDPFLKSERERIYRVGVELEGGWITLPKGTKVIRDSSVNLNMDERSIPVNYVGEMPSHILEVKAVPEWMRVHYPQVVNETCGMHVHMSMRTSFQYQMLMEPEYPGTLVAYIGKWAKGEKLTKGHPIWARLAGKSPYCQLVFAANEQINNTDKDYDRNRVGHRYTVINYCWRRWNTIECRLLPMMATPEQGINAVMEVIRITNAFLIATSPKGRKVYTAEHKDDPNSSTSEMWKVVV